MFVVRTGSRRPGRRTLVPNPRQDFVQAASAPNANRVSAVPPSVHQNRSPGSGNRNFGKWKPNSKCSSRMTHPPVSGGGRAEHFRHRTRIQRELQRKTRASRERVPLVSHSGKRFRTILPAVLRTAGSPAGIPLGSVRQTAGLLPPEQNQRASQEKQYHLSASNP